MKRDILLASGIVAALVRGAPVLASPQPGLIRDDLRSEVISIPDSAEVSSGFAVCSGLVLIPTHGAIVAAGWNAVLREFPHGNLTSLDCDSLGNTYWIDGSDLLGARGIARGPQRTLAGHLDNDVQVFAGTRGRLWLVGRTSKTRFGVMLVDGARPKPILGTDARITAASPIGNDAIIVAVGDKLALLRADGSHRLLLQLPSSADGLAVGRGGVVYISSELGIFEVSNDGQVRPVAFGIHGPLRARGSALYVLLRASRSVVRLSQNETPRPQEQRADTGPAMSPAVQQSVSDGDSANSSSSPAQASQSAQVPSDTTETSSTPSSPALALAEAIVGAATRDVGHGMEDGEIRTAELTYGGYPGEGNVFLVSPFHLRYGFWTHGGDKHHPVGPEIDAQIAAGVRDDGNGNSQFIVPVSGGVVYFHGWPGVGAHVGIDPVNGNSWVSLTGVLDLYQDASGGARLYVDGKFQSSYDDTVTFGLDTAINGLVLQGGLVWDPSTASVGGFGGLGFRFPLGVEFGHGNHEDSGDHTEDASATASNPASSANTNDPDRPTTESASTGPTSDYSSAVTTADPAPSPAAMPRSLYIRLGGEQAIAAIVNEFVNRIEKDDRIKDRFFNVDPGHLEKLMTEFVCKATGGPCTYEGRDMASAHAGMEVVGEEFDAVIQDLGAALASFKVPEDEKDELLGALQALRTQIVASPDKLHPIAQPELDRVTKLAAGIRAKEAQRLLGMAIIAGDRGQRAYAAELFTRAEAIVGSSALESVASVFRTDTAAAQQPTPVSLQARQGDGGAMQHDAARPTVAPIKSDTPGAQRTHQDLQQPYEPIGRASTRGRQGRGGTAVPVLFGAGAVAMLGTGLGLILWGESTYGDAKAEVLDQRRRDSLYNMANSRYQVGLGLAAGGLACASVALWTYFHGRHQASTTTAFRELVVSPRGIALIGAF